MTDIKKKGKGKDAAKGKKLQLNKETLKDLTTAQSKIENVRGGMGTCCSRAASGCVS